MVKGFIITLLTTRDSGSWGMGVFALSFAVLTSFFIVGSLGS